MSDINDMPDWYIGEGKCKVHIEEYIPPEEEKFVYCNTGEFWKDMFYDKSRKIHFFVVNEPDWIHIEENKTYKFSFEYDDDSNNYLHRLYKRLDDHTVITAEYYNDKFLETKDGYIHESVKRTTLEKYIESYHKEKINES